MSGEYGFQIIDASRSIKRVASDLKRLITRVIESEPATGDASAPTDAVIPKQGLSGDTKSA